MAEEWQREKRAFRDGEIVDEASDQRHEAEDNGDECGSAFPRVRSRSSPCDADQEGRESTRIEDEPNVVDLFDLLPAGLVVVMLRSRGGKLKHKCANQTHSPVNDTDIVAPPPPSSRVGVQRGGNQDTGRAPWYGDTSFGHANAGASAKSQPHCEICGYIKKLYRHLLGNSSEIPA